MSRTLPHKVKVDRVPSWMKGLEGMLHSSHMGGREHVGLGGIYLNILIIMRGYWLLVLFNDPSISHSFCSSTYMTVTDVQISFSRARMEQTMHHKVSSVLLSYLLNPLQIGIRQYTLKYHPITDN
ncbi:hypothetical protein K439DRAFT_750442 [Ramaria rubella]|nr:hypothetical protein K439DRAFT_750442 [Ramaria rubella]